MKKIVDLFHPIVAHVLVVGQRVHPYRLAPVERLVVRYATKTTIRADGHVSNIHHGVCWCLPTDDAWNDAQATHAAYQAALTALGEGLRALGRYPAKLAAAGGIKHHPEPLSQTVIACPDPDAKDGAWFAPPDNLGLPRITRHDVSKHTPKMLTITSGTIYDLGPRGQGQYSVCPSDEAWVNIQTLYATAEAAAQAWKKLLDQLGTYELAKRDGRYRSLQTAIQPSLLAEV